MGLLAEAGDARERMIVLADQVNDPSEFFRMRAYALGNHRAARADRAREASRMHEAQRIAETRFPSHPEHFALHYRLAYFYGSFPDWPKAIHHLRRAIALHLPTGNPDTFKYADAQGWLAFALAQVGEIRESLSLYEGALASWEKIGGNTARLRVTRAAYAMTLAEAGRIEESNRMFKKIADGYAANHQPETDDYAVTAYEAETALNTGRLQAALNVIARFPLPTEKVQVASAQDILLIKSLVYRAVTADRRAVRPRGDRLGEDADVGGRLQLRPDDRGLLHPVGARRAAFRQGSAGRGTECCYHDVTRRTRGCGLSGCCGVCRGAASQRFAPPVGIPSVLVNDS